MNLEKEAIVENGMLFSLAVGFKEIFRRAVVAGSLSLPFFWEVVVGGWSLHI